MNTIGERVKHIRELNNLSQGKYAKALGVSQSFLSDLEQNKTIPGFKILSAIHKNFDVNSDWIMDGQGEMFKKIPGVIGLAGPYKDKCPLLSGSACCGKPFSITDNSIESYIYYPPDISPDFAIQAKGYSMLEFGIVPGSICFVKKGEVVSGDIAAICVHNGEEAYPILKKVKINNGQTEFLDGKGEKVFFGKDIEIEIVGKVVFIGNVPGRNTA